MLDFDFLYQELKNQLLTVDKTNTLMVGVHTGGYWLAQHLHADLGFTQPLAALSTTLQRDDFASAGLHKQKLPTRLPLSLQGLNILLVDDVLHTGRSVRAAINELFEYGRPNKVELAVLVDRGGRQLPFVANYCAATIEVEAAHDLVLQQIGAHTQGENNAITTSFTPNFTPSLLALTLQQVQQIQQIQVRQ